MSQTAPARTYLLSDPRIVADFHDRVRGWAYTHFEAAVGYHRGHPDGSRLWRQVTNGVHNAGKYSDRVFAAVKDSQPVPPPTGPQIKGGIGPTEADAIERLVRATVAEHLAVIRAGLDCYED